MGDSGLLIAPKVADNSAAIAFGFSSKALTDITQSLVVQGKWGVQKVAGLRKEYLPT